MSTEATRLILVVEDEATLRSMLCYALESSGFRVLAAENVKQATQLMAEELPHLILLDWMLPKVSGIEFAVRVKKHSRSKHIPIVLLTAKNHEEDKLKGFEVGVDDYVVKPFSTKELLARIQAVLRRSGKGQLSVLQFDQLQIDLDAKRVRVGQQCIALSPIEYKLLVFLASNIDRVYSRDQLLDHVWGRDVYLDERTVDVQLRRLRAKLKPHGYNRLVQTVRGEGYRFSEYE